MKSVVAHSSLRHIFVLIFCTFCSELKLLKCEEGKTTPLTENMCQALVASEFGLVADGTLRQASQHRKLSEVPPQVSDMRKLCLGAGCPATVIHTVEAVGDARKLASHSQSLA